MENKLNDVDVNDKAKKCPAGGTYNYTLTTTEAGEGESAGQSYTIKCSVHTDLEVDEDGFVDAGEEEP